MSVKKTESEVRDEIQNRLSKEVPYRPFDHKLTREEVFQQVAMLKGVDLFDHLMALFDSTIKKELSNLAVQVIDDLGKVEYYVNNAGWDTEERRGREISTIWGLKNKYSNLTEED